MPLKIQHDEAPALNLTSMIDILFLLIIFFMLATKFDELERNIDVAVPEVSQATDTEIPHQPVVVCVAADGGIDLDGAKTTLEELTVHLTSKRTGAGFPPVVVRGDAACAFQHIAAVLAALRTAGVSELGITVRIASLGTPAAR